MSTIIVLIIWIGNPHGGPATLQEGPTIIQGFDTIAACERAAGDIERASGTFNSVLSSVYMKCMEFNR